MHPLEDYFRDKRYENTILFILVVLLLLLPYSFIIQSGEEWHYYQVSAAIWVLSDWSTVSGDADVTMNFLDLYAFLDSFFTTFFRYLFAIQIIRHHRGITTQKKTLISAALSLIPLLPLFVLSLFGLSLYAGGGIFGPIPLFLILGLVIDQFWGKEPPEEPWDEQSEIGNNEISEKND